MSRENRKRVIEEIEKKRGSRVIAYVTSDRSGLGGVGSRRGRLGKKAVQLGSANNN